MNRKVYFIMEEFNGSFTSSYIEKMSNFMDYIKFLIPIYQEN